MPKSNNQRQRGKHKGGRVQWTGNKFLLTSAEALVIQGQLGMLQQNLMATYGILHQRLVALEPPVVETPADAPSEVANAPT